MLGTEYTIGSAGAGYPVLVCRICGESLPMKSNLGISEEILRLSAYLSPKSNPSCKNESCSNHGVPVEGSSSSYYSYGKSDRGSQRYKCRACSKTFSVAAKSTWRQRFPEKNVQVLQLLMNKMPLSRICEVADISAQTLYDKIDFIHRQCLAFAGRQEAKLRSMTFRRLYVAVDRQDYTVNWTQRKDKRNITLRAIGSADLSSGYVFGMHLNFDASLNPDAVEPEAKALGDYTEAYPFRRFARFWLEPDYTKAVAQTAARLSKRGKPSATTALEADISGAYADAALREDVESSESILKTESWPKRGMQVRSEYTMYAHFYLLHELLRGAEKVRFFVDQESGIRAACLAAFEHEVKERRCDAFYVSIAKELTVDEKRTLIATSRAAFKSVQDANPTLTPYEVETLIMKAELTRAATIGKWDDRWCTHPFPNSAEPQKAMCWLTDIDATPADPGALADFDMHRARLYLKASLHSIDRFFMQARRRMSLLERPIGTSSKAGRTWYGYSAYQPENIEKLLGIFRVFYNYCLKGKDGQTPAARLGLALASVGLDDVLRIT